MLREPVGGVCVAILGKLATFGQKQQDFKHLVQVCQLAILGAFLATLDPSWQS